MQMFLTSDVIYSERVIPADRGRRCATPTSAPSGSSDQFLPGLEWLEPDTVADALGQQLSAGGRGDSGREPAPGLHGTGIDSVAGRRPDARPRRGRTGSPTAPDTEFTVNFTNQGENDEVDIDVDPQDRGRPEADPRHQERRRRSPPARQATATLGLDSPPPFDTAGDHLASRSRRCPGEEKTDNNKAEYDALFSQQ